MATNWCLWIFKLALMPHSSNSPFAVIASLISAERTSSLVSSCAIFLQKSLQCRDFCLCYPCLQHWDPRLEKSMCHIFLLKLSSISYNLLNISRPVPFLSFVPTLPIPTSASPACLSALSCYRVIVNITAVKEETQITTGDLLGGVNLYRIGGSTPGEQIKDNTKDMNSTD